MLAAPLPLARLPSRHAESCVFTLSLPPLPPPSPQLHARLVGLGEAVELLAKGAGGKGAEGKLLKAMQKLARLPTLEQVWVWVWGVGGVKRGKRCWGCLWWPWREGINVSVGGEWTADTLPLPPLLFNAPRSRSASERVRLSWASRMAAGRAVRARQRLSARCVWGEG